MYKKCLDEIDRKALNAKIDFMKKIPLFKHLTKTFLGKLTYNLKPYSCTKDSYLYKEGEIPDKVFFVKHGEFVVTKKQIKKNTQGENI